MVPSCTRQYCNEQQPLQNMIKLDSPTVKNIKHCSLSSLQVYLCLLLITMMSSYSMSLMVFIHLDQNRTARMHLRHNTHITLHSYRITTKQQLQISSLSIPFKKMIETVLQDCQHILPLVSLLVHLIPTWLGNLYNFRISDRTRKNNCMIIKFDVKENYIIT